MDTQRLHGVTLRTIGLVLMSALAVTACSGAASEPTEGTSGAADLWSGAEPPTEQMSETDAAAIDDVATAALAAAPDLPGMWIGVWDPDRGVHIAAYGDAVDGQTAATPDDHNRIGSVTKTFTATAVLEQVAAGELSLDDTIEEVLPDLAEAYPDLAPITVEQLLAMRSGIPDYANTGAVTGPVVEDPTKVWTVDEIIATTLEEEPLQPPGTPGYSTTNYLILGEMLETVTGDPVEETLNAVAAEAGLSDTALQAPEETQMPDPSSHGYLNAPGVESLASSGVTAEPGQDTTDWTLSWGQAGGGMYSTIADMGRWAAQGLGTALLPADVGEQRLQAQPTPEGDYGLGIFDWGDGWIGHTGQVIGWESLVAYNTQTGAVFVAMDNETASLSAAIPVAQAVFPDLVEGLTSS
jgi:D-alanyl-D-alanine carboxypeptidase